MSSHRFPLIVALLLLFFVFSCEEPAREEVDDHEIPTSLTYDFSGTWSLTAWIPIDCPGCHVYRYQIASGDMRFDSQTYDLKIVYAFNNIPDSIAEQGTYVHSTDYFISWGGGSTMFVGEIIFTPDQGTPWNVQYQIEDPNIQPNVVVFKNFILKNDTTEVMIYWAPKE